MKPSLGKMLSTMSRIYQHHMNDQLKPLKRNINDLAILMRVYNEPNLSLNELARRIHMNKAIASKSIRALIAEGLMKKKLDPTSHLQRFKLSLTANGQKLIPTLKNHIKAYQKSTLANLNKSESQQFLALLEKVYETKLT